MAPKKPPRRFGRPATLAEPSIFPLALERGTREALDRLAADRGLSTSALIRDVLGKYIEREGRK